MLQQRVARTRIVCFGSPNTAAASSINLHQDSSQIAFTSKSTRKLLHMAAHPSTSQCIFQDLEIPGRPQQHQITIIYLGCPYSSSITNTYLSYFRYYTRINYIAVGYVAACSICRKDAGERTGVQNADKTSASCVTLLPKGNLVIVYLVLVQ